MALTHFDSGEFAAHGDSIYFLPTIEFVNTGEQPDGSVLGAGDILVGPSADVIDIESVRASINTLTLVPPLEAHDKVAVTTVPTAKIDRPKIVSSPKKEKVPKLKLRASTLDDIPELVDVDMRSFGKVYKEYDIAEHALREDLIAKFTTRFNKTGGD